MKRIKLFAAVLVAALATSVGVSACSSGPAMYPTPTTWTVSYGGSVYCPYEYDPHEIDMYAFVGYQTCTRVGFPSLSLVPTTGLQFALMSYWTTYGSFFESGYWYDTYYAPLGSRYHVTVISRTSYMSNVSTFDRTYASQIKTNSAKAAWTGGKKGTYKFPTSNQKATKPIGNTGGGTKTNTNRTGGGSTGKTGTSRSGSTTRTGRR